MLLEDILPKNETVDGYEIEHNFESIGRKTMLLNACKIREKKNDLPIILLAIEDITERREIERGLEKARKELEVTKISEDEAREYAESIINTVREPLIALDQDLRVVTASRSFYEVFKVNPKETVGQLIYDLGNKQWNIPKLRELLETILPQKTTFDNYEVEHEFSAIGRRIMLLNARQIQRRSGKKRIILLAIEDITERKEIEAGLEKTRKELEVIKISADEASEFAESVINTVREPLISLDQDLRVVTVSRSFYEFFKVKPEETVGQLIYDLGNKQWNIPKLRELLETILPQKTTFDNYEVEHDFASIGRRIMLLNARQIQRKSGKKRIILLAIEDITERKRLEDLLAESEKRYRRIFETASDGIVLLEKREGTITQANPAAEKMLGYSEEEYVGKKLQDIGVSIDMSDFPAIMKALDKSGIINYDDVPVKTRSGQNIYTDIYMVDRASLAQCNIRDVTERKRAEENHREDEKKYKELFDSTLDGIYQVDADGVFVMMNPAGARIFGYESPEEIIGRNALEYWRDPKDRDAFRAELKIKKSVSGYHMRARNKNGKPVELESTSIIREDANGNFLGIDGILRDVTERMRADERIDRHIQKLSALRSIDLAISSSLDIRVTLKVFLEQVVTQLHVDACDVLLLNPHAKTLDYAASQGFRTSALRHTHLRLGQGYAGVAALENRIVSIPDVKRDDNDFKRLGVLEGEDIVAYYGVPLVAKGQVKGVLEIFHRSPLEPDEEWLEFLEALALQAAIAIDSNSLFQELERSNMGLALAYDSTIEGWSRALDYRDKETEGHSQRVTEITIKIAREMGMNEEELVHVRWGALLHDIGKMGIPDSILLKPGPLTEEEWKIMRLHPVYAYELLHPIDYLRSALDVPYCHHEKWDGTGYPRGLKGEQIPLSGRIFAVVDVWDALRSDRPYRPAWPKEKTFEHIRQLAGTHFDPKVVEVFFSFMTSGIL